MFYNIPTVGKTNYKIWAKLSCEKYRSRGIIPRLALCSYSI